ncbi:MAG: hypothetical protein DHS20C18_28080 [Saprospiraceae bacterium]|nr:MAG: hypothetical protein DHS20C18_28080 [Saprospiraceae bacterium]
MENFNLDEKAYNELLNLLDNQHFTEKPGFSTDMAFLSDDWWLRDTAVIENIVKRDGMWEIQLVFAHFQEPQKLIKRVISRHSCKDRAELNAWYMRRLAAKDQRGTLKVNIEDFKLCPS